LHLIATLWLSKTTTTLQLTATLMLVDAGKKYEKPAHNFGRQRREIITENSLHHKS